MSGSERVSKLLLSRRNAAVTAEQVNNLPFKVLPLDKIIPDPDQPRKTFTEESINELAESIQARGVLQPITVVPHEDDKYMLVSGERRWRASRLAELIEIPAYIGNKHAKNERLIDALVENIIREDLSAIEKARAIVQIREMNPKMSDSALAKKIGISRQMLYRLLNITKLPEDIQVDFFEHKLSDRHAKALLLLKCKPGLQKELFQTILEKSLSGEAAIKLAEEWIKEVNTKVPKTAISSFYNGFMLKADKVSKKLPKVKDEERDHIERQLSEMKAAIEKLERQLKEI